MESIAAIGFERWSHCRLCRKKAELWTYNSSAFKIKYGNSRIVFFRKYFDLCNKYLDVTSFEYLFWN